MSCETDLFKVYLTSQTVLSCTKDTSRTGWQSAAGDRYGSNCLLGKLSTANQDRAQARPIVLRVAGGGR
jgi:hypothetical protein